MVLRHRNYQQLRTVVTLGTGLTALFLLVRCSVPERDYSQLGIGGENAGSAGESGASGGGAGGSSAGQAGGGSGGLGGTGDGGGQGGQAGAPPIEPVPCVEHRNDNDAGINDAGATDGGTTETATDTDAGSLDAACECVDGFVRAVDADGDGERSQACSLAPGLDCDDGDAAVTHNGCGGCSALPSTLGDDCLECGTYICNGPDAVACGAKPGPVEDPDCRCEAGLIVARDTDGDGQGTRLCEANPGSDCNDGDGSFVTNQCGGCAELAGAVGDACNECGVYACNGVALACVPSTGSAGRQCLGSTSQTCIGSGFWGSNVACPDVCYQGNCELCTPGAFQCVPLGGGSFQLQRCGTIVDSVTSSSAIGWGSYDSCLPTETCDAVNGRCTTGYLLLPRDHGFDVAPLPHGALPWHELLNTASETDYG